MGGRNSWREPILDGSMRLPLVILLTAGPLLAHPGVGIVRDAKGNIFYTDLKQVWRLAPDGTRSLAVPQVHTHELCLDAAGNLYGEHLWYEGERTDRWGHRVWRLGTDGSLGDVIHAREGFLKDYSFVRDGAGHHYVAQRGATTTIQKRLPDGRLAPHCAGPFADLRWMAATAAGVLFVVDASDLKRVEPDGTVRTLAAGLQPRRAGNLWRYDRHALMGLWTDGPGNVYVAATADREVRRVDPRGRVTVAATSPFPWSPSGGLVAPDGALWLLECSTFNAVRVRRIGTDGRERVFP